MKTLQFTEKQIQLLAWVLLQSGVQLTENETKEFGRARRKVLKALKETETTK